MPTTLHRFQVTETPQVERALAAAAREWPDASRAERIVRLLEAGADALDSSRDRRAREYLGAVDFSSGSLTGAYEPGYLQRLRDEWPR